MGNEQPRHLRCLLFGSLKKSEMKKMFKETQEMEIAAPHTAPLHMQLRNEQIEGGRGG
jgi:hypothetical protein